MLFTKSYLDSFSSRTSLLERILSKTIIDKSGCWIFTGGKDRCGYGRLKIGPHNVGAHKVCYIMIMGDYDQDKFELLHSCDNPSCVNPAHLSPDTHKANMYDCLSKGRHVCQNRHSSESPNGIIMYQTSRTLALVNGDKIYGGKVCKLHPENKLRITGNGACIICNAIYTKSKRLNVQTWSRKCVL